jgi:hypothetical protein
MSNLPKVIELDREGLYFVSRDGDYWVYVDAVDRLVKVFRDMEDAIAYGLHTNPADVSIEVIDKGIEVVGDRGWEIRYRNFVVRVCVDNECEEYRAWGDVE